MNFGSDLKSVFMDNIFLIAICMFVIIYIIINYDGVINGDIKNFEIIKSILITGIIILILYLFATWDNDDETNSIIIPKYKLGNNDVINEYNNNNMIPASMQSMPLMQSMPVITSVPIRNTILKNNNGYSKYKIVNNSLDNKSITNLDKLSNQNIFISHKNIEKYGLKF